MDMNNTFDKPETIVIAGKKVKKQEIEKTKKIAQSPPNVTYELREDTAKRQNIEIEFDVKSEKRSIDSLTGQTPLSEIKDKGIEQLILMRENKSQAFRQEIMDTITGGKITLPMGTALVRIESTDSDFHYGAKRVMKLHCCNSDGTEIETLYYKPHDMASENLVFGKDSIFSKFGLPTLDIEELQGAGVVKDAIIDDKIEKRDEHYIKKCLTDMGKIIALSELLGIGDLHVENIVPTKDGTTIIDGEFLFNPDIMTGKNDSNLTNRNGGYNDEWTYLNGGLYSMIQRIEGISDAPGLPISIPESHFNYLVDGYMEIVTSKDSIPFEDMYNKLNMVRLTPMGTQDLANYLIEFWKVYGKLDATLSQSTRLDQTMQELRKGKDFIKTIQQDFVKTGYCDEFNQNHEIALGEAMALSFYDGGIPRFSFKPSSNQILLDNTIIIEETNFSPENVKKIFEDKKSTMPENREAVITHIENNYHVNSKVPVAMPIAKAVPIIKETAHQERRISTLTKVLIGAGTATAAVIAGVLWKKYK